MKKGKVCLNHTAILATEGTVISNLEELEARKIAFATVFGSSEVGEYFDMFSKEG